MNTTSKISIFCLLFIFSCKTELGQGLKISADILKEFRMEYVTINYGEDTYTFELQDGDHEHMALDDLKALSLKIDNYIINKYPKVDSMQIRKYKFAGGLAKELVEFTIDDNGQVINIKGY